MKHTVLNTRQKISLLCLALFLILMATAAVIAENVYYDSLPVVTVGTASRDKLQAEYNVDGAITYAKQEQEYFSDGDFQSVELLVQQGDMVKQWQSLYRIAPDELLLAQKKLELAALMLEQETQSLGEDEVSVLKKEVNRLEAEKIHNQIESLKQLYDQQGIVTAPVEGEVSLFISNHSPVVQGQKIAAVTGNTDRGFLSWQMPAEQGKDIHLGDPVRSVITVQEQEDEETVEKNITYQTKVTQIDSLPQGQGFSFRARIGEDVTLSMEEGEWVTVTCKSVTKESYPYVVPLSALDFEEDGTYATVYIIGTRQRIFGEESYVIPCPVEVIYTLGNTAALMNFTQDKKIVVYSQVPLSENQAVRIREG